jgi:hypothetical protein
MERLLAEARTAGVYKVILNCTCRCVPCPRTDPPAGLGGLEPRFWAQLVG